MLLLGDRYAAFGRSISRLGAVGRALPTALVNFKMALGC